jgi:hypothetical protein
MVPKSMRSTQNKYMRPDTMALEVGIQCAVLNACRYARVPRSHSHIVLLRLIQNLIEDTTRGGAGSLDTRGSCSNGECEPAFRK